MNQYDDTDSASITKKDSAIVAAAWASIATVYH